MNFVGTLHKMLNMTLILNLLLVILFKSAYLKHIQILPTALKFMKNEERRYMTKKGDFLV